MGYHVVVSAFKGIASDKTFSSRVTEIKSFCFCFEQEHTTIIDAPNIMMRNKAKMDNRMIKELEMKIKPLKES